MNITASPLPVPKPSFTPVVFGNLIALVLSPLGAIAGLLGLVAATRGIVANARGNSIDAARHHQSASTAARFGIYGSLILLVLGFVGAGTMFFIRR